MPTKPAMNFRLNMSASTRLQIGSHNDWKGSKATFQCELLNVLIGSMLLKKSKIVRRQKSRKCWLLDTDAVDARSSANTAVRGRFSEKGRGPSHRCTRNVSAALENFVRHPQNTFSTVSVKSGSRGLAAGCLLHPQKRDIGRTFPEVRLVPATVIRDGAPSISASGPQRRMEAI